MNLYQFFKNYLETQILNRFPDFKVNELSLYFSEPKMYYCQLRLNIQKGKETINDMMKALAYTLTLNPYKSLPSYIFSRNYDLLEELLNDFDPEYINMINPTVIFNIVKRQVTDCFYFGFTISKDQTLLDYFEELKSAAKYLLDNFKDYNSYISYIKTNPEETLKEILKIKGLGPYCAKKYLNFIGSFQLFNIHSKVIDLFKIIDKKCKR